MGFFSDLGKKTSETTSKIAKETKLKMKINENKGKITDIYEIIGKKVYEAHKKEMPVDYKDYLKDECTQLDDLSNEIEQARIEILKLNNKKICQNCFAEMETNAQFCPKCGQKQDEGATVKEEALEKLENTEISEDKKEEAEIVKQELEQNISENSSQDNIFNENTQENISSDNNTENNQ